MDSQPEKTQAGFDDDGESDYHVLLTRGSNRWAVLFESERSGALRWWHAEATGAIVGKRELWEPLGEGVAVAPLPLNTTQPGLRAFKTAGVLDPNTPHEAAVLAFYKQKQAAEEPTEAFYELRCLGGSREAHPWPMETSGSSPVEILLTWHSEDTPRLFWKEQSGPKGEEVIVPENGWYTAPLPAPSCK